DAQQREIYCERLGASADGGVRAARLLRGDVRKAKVPMSVGSHRSRKKGTCDVLQRRRSLATRGADKPVEAVVLLRVARMGSRSARDGSPEKVPRPRAAKVDSRSPADPAVLQNGARALWFPRGSPEADHRAASGIEAGIV